MKGERQGLGWLCLLWGTLAGRPINTRAGAISPGPEDRLPGLRPHVEVPQGDATRRGQGPFLGSGEHFAVETFTGAGRGAQQDGGRHSGPTQRRPHGLPGLWYLEVSGSHDSRRRQSEQHCSSYDCDATWCNGGSCIWEAGSPGSGPPSSLAWLRRRDWALPAPRPPHHWRPTCLCLVCSSDRSRSTRHHPSSSVLLRAQQNA